MTKQFLDSLRALIIVVLFKRLTSLTQLDCLKNLCFEKLVFRNKIENCYDTLIKTKKIKDKTILTSEKDYLSIILLDRVKESRYKIKFVL